MILNYEAEITMDTIFCRAQIGHNMNTLTKKNGMTYDTEVPIPFEYERMLPLRNKAKEGRVNPKGIPYLYLCNDEETAIAECRPWLEQLISVGYFKVKSNLKLVHFTQERKSLKIYFSTPPENEIDKLVWDRINYAFSQPVSVNDFTSDYIPTQILAEIIKNCKYDGIIYKSKLGKGLNIALFNINSVVFQSSKLFEVKDIQYRIDSFY